MWTIQYHVDDLVRLFFYESTDDFSEIIMKWLFSSWTELIWNFGISREASLMQALNSRPSDSKLQCLIILITDYQLVIPLLARAASRRFHKIVSARLRATTQSTRVTSALQLSRDSDGAVAARPGKFYALRSAYFQPSTYKNFQPSFLNTSKNW
jgi:hypothetical protein